MVAHDRRGDRAVGATQARWQRGSKWVIAESSSEPESRRLVLGEETPIGTVRMSAARCRQPFCHWRARPPGPRRRETSPMRTGDRLGRLVAHVEGEGAPDGIRPWRPRPHRSGAATCRLRRCSTRSGVIGHLTRLSPKGRPRTGGAAPRQRWGRAGRSASATVGGPRASPTARPSSAPRLREAIAWGQAPAGPSSSRWAHRSGPGRRRGLEFDLFGDGPFPSHFISGHPGAPGLGPAHQAVVQRQVLAEVRQVPVDDGHSRAGVDVRSSRGARCAPAHAVGVAHEVRVHPRALKNALGETSSASKKRTSGARSG